MFTFYFYSKINTTYNTKFSFIGGICKASWLIFVTIKFHITSESEFNEQITSYSGKTTCI